MLKSVILFPILLGVSFYTFADTATYNKYMKEVSLIEAKLSKCIPDVNESHICYNNAEKKYDNIIKSIRKAHSSKVDIKLWQSINLGFESRKNNCRSEYLDAGPTQLFYPYIDCLNSSYHGLTVTTIELHLK